MKSKSDILKEALDRNGINSSMPFTRKSVYEAMEEYSKQNVEEIEKKFDAVNTEFNAMVAVVNLLIEAENAEELIHLRDSLRNGAES